LEALMIQHVTRHVPPMRLQDCVDFYALLGFGPVPVPPTIGGEVRSVERRGTQVHLMPVDDARPAPGNVAVVVDAYDETVARLRDAGHEAQPRREHWGAPRAFVSDPAGNLVEIMAWAPGTST
jgi:catechol 2,3-dioxygenase-like lactoylglutathione lyase family enzyme